MLNISLIFIFFLTILNYKYTYNNSKKHKLLGVWQLSSIINLNTKKINHFEKIISYHFHSDGHLIVTDTMKRQRSTGLWTLNKDQLKYYYKLSSIMYKGKINFFKKNTKFYFYITLKKIPYKWTFTKLE